MKVMKRKCDNSESGGQSSIVNFPPVEQVPLPYQVSFPMGNGYSVTRQLSRSNDPPNVFLDMPTWLDFL